MKAPAVEDEGEEAVGRRRGEKIQCREAAAQIAAIHLVAGLFDRERGNIDSEHIEAALRQPNCVRPGARADLERPAWRDGPRRDELDEQRLRQPVSQGNSPEA
jgi:hypothetical protein